MRGRQGGVRCRPRPGRGQLDEERHWPPDRRCGRGGGRDLRAVNANLRELDPDCDLDIVRDASRTRRVRIALSNSLGFGGSNSCLAFRHPEDVEALS
jgi:hypothetical protein